MVATPGRSEPARTAEHGDLVATTSISARATRSGAGVLVAALLAACGTATSSSEPVAQHAAHVSAQQQAAPTDALALRSTLERLLGAHVLLADEFVRTAVTGKAEQNAAVGQSVARNQAELVQLVTAQGGAAAGQEFQAAWQNHVDVLARYATALQAKDTAAQQQARPAVRRRRGAGSPAPSPRSPAARCRSRR
jgi:hypothetical protein